MSNLFHGVTKYLQKEGAHFLVPEGCIAPYRALESHMPRILSHFGLRAHWGKNGKFSLKIKLKLEWANFWSVLPLLHLMMYPKLNLEKS